MSLRDLSDSSVLAGFARIVGQSHSLTAALLAHILEIESRGIYRDEGFDSIRAFLVAGHHFSEDAAERRLQAAHAVWRHPELLERVADGRLHLTAVGMLSAHLDESNAAELIEAATHRTRSQIQALLLARKSPPVAVDQPEIALSAREPALAQVHDGSIEVEPAPAQVDDESGPDEPSPERVPNERLSKITVRERTRAMLRHAHDLLAGSVPFGDHDEVLARALRELIARLEKRKFGKVSKPRKNPKPCTNPRTIPAEVRRGVAARDGGRCTFVGPTGHRCESRAVQFDHVITFARGGASTVPNLRQLCRAHNQLEAERVFGRDFMDRKRKERDDPEHRDLVAGLRHLGYRRNEAKEAADFALRETGLSLEQRMRVALAWFRPRVTAAAVPAT